MYTVIEGPANEGKVQIGGNRAGSSSFDLRSDIRTSMTSKDIKLATIFLKLKVQSFAWSY